MSRIGGAWYELSVEASKFKQGLAEAEAQAGQSSDKIAGDLGKIERGADDAAAGVDALTGVLGSLASIAVTSIVHGLGIMADEMERAAKTQKEMEAVLLRLRSERQGAEGSRASGIDAEFNRQRIQAETEYRERVRKLNADRVTDEKVYQLALEERDAKTRDINAAEERAQQRRIENLQREKNLFEQGLADRGGELANRLATDALSKEEQINQEYRKRLELADDIARLTGFDITAEQLRTAALQDRNKRLQDLEDEAQKRRDSAADKMLREQERILKENTKNMEAAFKEFGKFVDKLERIQQSWDEGFNLINGGQDLKRIGELLQSWGPNIRSL